MFSMSDYILVDRNGELFRISIENLNNIYLPIGEDDRIEELTDQIDEMKDFIYELSSEIIQEYTPISELNEKYEQKISTDYMLEDPTILDDIKIEKKIANSKLVFKDDAYTAFSNEVEKCDNLFQSTQGSIEDWFS